MSCWQKCRKRYSSHDTKVVTLPPHHPHRAMRRFHILHKSVCIPTDWADWASRPFCLLEVHLVPRLSSYRNRGATRAALGAWAEPHSWVNRRAFACFSPFQSHFVGALNTVLSKKKKKKLSMTKIGRFLRGFSVVDFSAVGFVELLKTLKDSTPKITVPVQVWFSLAKQCISMVWFPNSWFYLSGRKCIVAMFSCFKTKSEKKIYHARFIY